MSEISQTTFDQMVSDEQTQMMKAVIPYLPPRMQQFFSFYAKSKELQNTMQMFSSQKTMQACGVPDTPTDPLAIINDIRKYTYGQSQQQLDQLTNLFAMLEMISVMNQT